MSERIAATVNHYGLAEEAVVYAGGTLEAAGIRPASDVDLCVSPEAFRALREAGGWVEGRCDDGQPKLQRSGDGEHMPVEVVSNWGEGYSYEDLRRGSFRKDDICFAGLDAVYAWKQDKGRPKDTVDLALIKERLYARPLPDEMVARQLEFMRQHAPQSLHDHPALKVGANGLVIVDTLYGRDSQGPARRYSGLVEKDIPVFGHTCFHSAGGIKHLAQQVRLSNERRRQQGLPPLYSEADLAALYALFPYHDAIIGDGRVNDETKSAELVRQHLILGGSDMDDIPERAAVGVKGTIYDDIARVQSAHIGGEYAHIQETAKGLDLGNLPEAFSPLESFWMCVEDLCRAKAGHDRILAIRAEELGVTITDLETALAVVDSSPATIAAFASKTNNCGLLHSGHKYPGTYEMDDPEVRQEHALCLHGIAQRVKDGDLTASDLLGVIHRHIDAIAEKMSARARRSASGVPNQAQPGEPNLNSGTRNAFALVEMAAASGPAIDLQGSLLGLAGILESIDNQHVPAVVGGLEQQMSLLESCIAEIQANINDQNRQQAEARIELLRRAIDSLAGAASTLSEGDNSVRGHNEEYRRDIGAVPDPE